MYCVESALYDFCVSTKSVCNVASDDSAAANLSRKSVKDACEVVNFASARSKLSRKACTCSCRSAKRELSVSKFCSHASNSCVKDSGALGLSVCPCPRGAAINSKRTTNKHSNQASAKRESGCPGNRILLPGLHGTMGATGIFDLMNCTIVSYPSCATASATRPMSTHGGR